MRDLSLSLDKHRYGSSAAQYNVDRESIEVDAFMHPIVAAYRFDEALDMFARCQVDWAAVNGINTVGESKLIDLDEVESELRPLRGPDPYSAPKGISLVALSDLKQSGQAPGIELLTEPTGFTVLAGRGNSLSKLGPRVQGNLTPFRRQA